MSTGNSDFFTYFGAAFGTAAFLFGATGLYGSYIDMKYHADLKAAGPNQSAIEARDGQLAKLAQGKMSIDSAMKAIALRGRNGFASIAPAASDDLSAVSGWVHHPQFKPAVAHPIRTPRAVIAPAPVAVEPAPVAVEPVAPPTPAKPAKPGRLQGAMRIRGGVNPATVSGGIQNK